mmetsp:Transcript_21712/g.27653  ORF Transcript_21712/g.27653 Transcript_21712/m.27653 type:complete len:233 (-) Transcript_21712:33-731(-)
MSLQDWYNDIPPITRVLFTSSFACTLLPSFGFLSAYNLILSYQSAVQGFEIWRLFTCFFVYSLGLPFLMNMVFLYRYSTALEKGAFAGRTGDYLWMLLTTGFLLILIGFWWPFSTLGKSLILVIVYYWSRTNPSAVVSFYFGIKFEAVYFPWALTAMAILLGGSPIPHLFGIAVGHVYFFLEDVAPLAYGYRLLKTPNFIYNMMDPSLNINTGRVPQRAPVRRAWGNGQRLG